ncbi:MAG: type II toxin-antitoxin system RelE/ParE family toxin [Acidobacteria bacterium]|nr:type II toxin-antitoxin system RelE/ParE family toxin [Acidobacteriota bacterium]
MKVVWTAEAWKRLQEIETYIAQAAPRAASNFVDRLISRSDALARHPNRGRSLPEMPASGLRELVVDKYRVVYRRGPHAIEILTVFEGHRLLRRDELPE